MNRNGPRPSALRDEIIAVLRRRRERLCATCLGVLLAVTPSAAHGAGRTIELMPDGTRGVGHCARCGKLRVVHGSEGEP